jgi:hypothetical protein
MSSLMCVCMETAVCLTGSSLLLHGKCRVSLLFGFKLSQEDIIE